jgi:prepilin-type N-terminal cleavage/methylation domain-containing protein
MKSCKYEAGFTLVEMLIVVAIIALLATMVVGLASRISNKTKEQFAESTIAIISAALEQFYDYGYSYPPPYSEFDFPLDCNDFSQAALETTLRNALGAVSVSISGGTHKNEYSGSEALYFFLSRVPECRAALDKIAGSLITNKDSYSNDLKLVIDGKEYPLLRVADPWRERGTTTKTGKTLRYDYYDEKTLDPRTKRNFPVITSAGPDGIFDTADDISSR